MSEITITHQDGAFFVTVTVAPVGSGNSRFPTTVRMTHTGGQIGGDMESQTGSVEFYAVGSWETSDLPGMLVAAAHVVRMALNQAEEQWVDPDLTSDMNRERYTFNDLLRDKGPEAVAEAIRNAKPVGDKDA